jgi:hypothetical protein
MNLDWDELPSAVRRDAEPDRGPTLLLLATITLWCGVLSLVTLVPSLVVVPLGFYLRAAAASDLRKMRAMQMDTGGQTLTRRAWTCASIGTALALGGLAVLVITLGCVLAANFFRS